MRAAVIYVIICLACTWLGYAVTRDMIPPLHELPADDGLASLFQAFFGLLLILQAVVSVSVIALGALAGFGVGVLIVGMTELVRRILALRRTMAKMQ